MHIPDGFLDAKTIIATGAFSAAGLGTALRQAGKYLQSRRIPLIGLTAAFIFVAQMVNFPVAGGTSGHLLGATLAAVLLGPSAAVIVMSSVLIVQSFLFADGGVLALGANIFNMGLVAPLCGYGIYRLFRLALRNERGRLIAVSFASWCATVIAAVFCAGELAWSGTVAWGTVFPAMAGVHMLIGVGEALITMLVMAAIASTRPELLNERSGRDIREGLSPTFIYAAIILIGLVVLVVPYASSLPDGLEKVAAALGFEHRALTSPIVSPPLKDYRVPGLSSTSGGTMAAGLIGAVVVFGLSFVLARVLVPHSKHVTQPQSSVEQR
jgi:cobalt/nickel transport system permease protein